LLALNAVIALAQPSASRVSITNIEGSVYVDGQRLELPVSRLPIKESSLVRTENGRAKILLAAGDIVFLDKNSSVRVSDNPNANASGLEILTGSAVVVTGELAPSVACEETVHLSDAGVFRFNVHHVVDQNFCQLKVYKGAAGAQMPSFVWVLQSGRLIDMNELCGDHTPRGEFNTDEIDALDRWSRQLTEAPRQ
jgi:hypothetical protein